MEVSVGTAEFDGILMKYARFGQGERDLLILPGLSVKPVTDVAQAVALSFGKLAQEMRIWLFDRRLNVPDVYSMEAMAEDTYRAAKSLGITRAGIYGTSQGGLMGVRIASMHPDFVERLMIVSSAALSDTRVVEQIRVWSELARKGDRSELIDCFIDKVYSRSLPESIRRMIRRSNDSVTEEQLRRFAVYADAIGSLPDLEAPLACPSLVVGAEGDLVVPIDLQRRSAERMGAETFFYPAEFAHAVYDEAPDMQSRIFDFFSLTQRNS